MSANFGNSPRRGSDVSVTIGASRNSFEMQQHLSPKPSYRTMTSQYSVATAFAIDRVPQPVSGSAPPVPALPVAGGAEQESSLPLRAAPTQRQPMRVMTRSGKTLRADGVFVRPTPAKEPDRQTAMPRVPTPSPSTGSFDIISRQEIEVRYAHLDETEAKLNGTWSGYGEQYSPPPYMTKADVDNLPQRRKVIQARINARDAALRTKITIPIGAVATFEDAAELPGRKARPSTPAEAADQSSYRLHHELARGMGPETSFNVSEGDAVILPEAGAIPYASNSPQPRPAGLFRSFSKTLKKVTGLARHDSDAARTKITHVPGSFAFDQRSYPNGATVVQDALPIREAQRLHSQRLQARPDGSTLSGAPARSPNVPSPKNHPVPKRSSKANLPAAQQPSPAKAPETPRKTKIVGNANRQTQFGDFINFSDDSDSGKSVQLNALQTSEEPSSSRAPQLVSRFSDSSDSGKSVDLNAVQNSIESSSAKAAPPLPTWTKATVSLATGTLKINRKTILPAGAAVSTGTAPTTIKRKPVPRPGANVQKPLPSLPRSKQDHLASLIAEPEGTNGLGFSMPTGDLFDSDGSDDFYNEDDDLTGREFTQMPTNPDELFGANDIIRQVDRMNNLSLQDKEGAATEAQRLQKMFDQPPPGAMGVDVQDFAPTTVIDTTRHDGHTSWRMTDTSKPNIIESYYKQVPNLPPPRQQDEAAALFSHLERERYGKSPSRHAAMNRRR